MLKVAILDDYQNVSQEFVDLKKLSGKYEIKVFSEPFIDENDGIEQLNDFEALLIMRERTKITENLISNLKKLKFIITSGMRNKAVNLDAAKKRKIIVSGTEINTNPTCELTWALILGLARNIKPEIDNMYQGYWQTTVGVELKGKILGLIGLGKVGSQVAKIGKAFGTIETTIDECFLHITMYREEIYDKDSRKPEVKTLSNLDKDLSRRDFTINALAYDMNKNEIIDFVIQINGKKKEIMKVKKDINEKTVMELIKKDDKIIKNFKNKEIDKVFFVKNRLINILLK